MLGDKIHCRAPDLIPAQPHVQGTGHDAGNRFNTDWGMLRAKWPHSSRARPPQHFTVPDTEETSEHLDAPNQQTIPEKDSRIKNDEPEFFQFSLGREVTVTLRSPLEATG